MVVPGLIVVEPVPFPVAVVLPLPVVTAVVVPGGFWKMTVAPL